MWKVFTHTVTAVLVAPIIFSMLRFNDRARAFYYVCMFTIYLFVMTIGKLHYHEARPFWASESILAHSCSTQYGNPSGHSLFALGSALTIWLDYNASMKKEKHTNSIFSRWYTRFFCLIIALAYGFLIGYSRIVLGAHSWS